MRSATDFLGRSNPSPTANRSGKIDSTLSRLGARANQVWTSLLHRIEAAHEPRIWVKADDDGNSHWHVYDPISDRHQVLSSEDEVRAYLDERFSD